MQPRGVGADNDHSFLEHCIPCTSAESLAHDGREDSAGPSGTPTRGWLRRALQRT